MKTAIPKVTYLNMTTYEANRLKMCWKWDSISAKRLWDSYLGERTERAKTLRHLSYHLPQIPQIMEEAAEEFSEFRCTEEERLKKKMPLKNSTDFAEAAERNLKISNAVERKITLMKNMFFDRLDEITEEMTFTSPREAEKLKRMFSDESPF